MLISAPTDFRKAARRKLPPFLFHYIDGGAYAEHTMRRNRVDLSDVALRQRVLRNVSGLDTSTTLFGQKFSLPAALAPVGLTGMYARRGEVQAARAAARKGIPFTLSTVSVCPIEEVQSQSPAPIWFQLYVLKDRGFMRNVLERARDAGVTTLVFTVDMPTPGARYRDVHSGMSGPYAAARRIAQAVLHPNGPGMSVSTEGRMILVISRPIVATRRGSKIISAGSPIISTRPLAGKIWNGSVPSGKDRC